MLKEKCYTSIYCPNSIGSWLQSYKQGVEDKELKHRTGIKTLSISTKAKGDIKESESKVP